MVHADGKNEGKQARADKQKMFEQSCIIPPRKIGEIGRCRQ